MLVLKLSHPDFKIRVRVIHDRVGRYDTNY